MPHYTIRRRIIALSRSYTVKDETGQLVFRLVGKVRFARTFMVNDRSGITQFTVREKSLSLDPTFVITKDGTQVAVVRRNIDRTSDGKDLWQIELSSDLAMEATSCLIRSEGVRIMQGTSLCATIRQTGFLVTQVFTMETVSTIDPAFILAIAMPIVEREVMWRE